MVMEVPGWMKKIRKKISVGAADEDIMAQRRANVIVTRQMAKDEKPFDITDPARKASSEGAVIDFMYERTKRKELAKKIRGEQ